MTNPMKIILYLLLVISVLFSCDDYVTSMYNYRKSVVVDMYSISSKLGSTPTRYYMKVRTKYDNSYVVKTIQIPRHEYVSIELGDTIK